MNKKVSELLEATSIKDEDVIMILQNGQNKKVQVNLSNEKKEYIKWHRENLYKK